MNKATLIENIANETGVTKADADRVLKSFINNVETAIKAGETVGLVGFGTFKKKSVKAKEGVSVLRGVETPWKSEAFDTIAFKASKKVRF